VMDLDLSSEDVAVLETRTEGWIAGLQLAALSLRGHEDIARFITTFSGDNRYIVDYLVDEVLQRQPERVRGFLLQTSILDRLSGPLCDAVTAQNDSRVLLDALERGNLFVVPLDDTRHWFRYHHLFADVLAAHALQEQPAHVPILHQRASAWYADNGFPADAIRHALAAKDFARAAGLLELAWPTMDARFQAATWLGWAKALPDDLFRVRPVLTVAYAWALLNGGELEPAEARLGDAERWLDSSTERSERPQAPSSPSVTKMASERVIVDEAQFRTLPASIATARAYLVQARGDVAGSVTYGRRALELLPAEDHLRRGPAAALLGLTHWARGDLEAAHRAISDAMANFQKVGNLHFAISGTFGLADIRMAQGRLREAVRTYTQALQLALEQGEPLLRGTADLYVGLSELYREQGDLESARAHLRRGEELGDQAALPDWRYRLYRVQARLQETEGDLAGALDRLDEAERHYYRTPLPDVRPLAALRTRMWVAQGRLRDALRWVQEQGLSVDDELSYVREFDHITLARVLITEYTRDRADRLIREATRLLERLQQAAEAGGRMGSVIEIGVLQALAEWAQGNLAAALVALERALRLAEPEGYVRIFVDEGPPMARLLSAAAAHGIMPDYIGRLLAAFATVEAEAQPRTDKGDMAPASPAQPLIEPLSAREVEILQLIAQGLSNGEIGARLFLAVSTVKGHNRNIFDKLQVQRRTEAVARARKLGLL
jgi:LuxR family transcriptional regulator, maltose regulon positive regulatory protein